MKNKMARICLAIVIFLSPAFYDFALAQEDIAQEDIAQDETAQEDIAQDETAQEGIAQDETVQEGIAQDEMVQDNAAPDNQRLIPPAVELLPPISRLSGEDNISLNIKGMDILDVLKMLAGYSNMNIVVGKNVSGRVTLFLKNVNVWDAFEIILLANDLAYEKKSGIIYIITQREYELLYGQKLNEKTKAKIIPLKYARAEDLAASLNQMKSNLGRIVVDIASNTVVLIDTPEKITAMQNFIKAIDSPVETRIFNLNYAQAEKLQAKIQDTLTKNIGRIKIDERTNKIAVTDYPAKLDELAKVISAFDEKNLQVLIDAQIIEVKPKDEFKMGVDWDYWLKKNFRLAASFPTSGAVNKLSFGTAADGRVLDEKGEYKGIIDLLRTIGDLKILSSPRIMAVSNQEAKILVGTKEPYASQTTVTGDGGTVTTAESINFVDVGIKLYVTPTVSRDNFVAMKIKPEVSSTGTPYVTAKGETIPIVSTSEAETSVIVKDGVTIIIGGLTKHKTDKETSRIPLLGNIPVLGALFGRTSNVSEKTELVILLTPHILSGETSFTDFSDVPPKDGAVVELEKGNLVIKKKGAGFQQGTAKKDGFSEYYTLVSDKVKAHALFIISPEAKEKGEAEISFTLSKNGNLIDEPKVSKSSNPLLAPIRGKSGKIRVPISSFSRFSAKRKRNLQNYP
ncbi:MAG: secretin N-terminal domain-containing protein [Candidatus Omnitrophota bacterium]